MFCEYHATTIHITWQYWIIESIMKQSLYIIYNNNLQYTTCHWFYIASVSLQHSNTVPYALQELYCTQETVPLKKSKRENVARSVSLFNHTSTLYLITYKNNYRKYINMIFLINNKNRYLIKKTYTLDKKLLE